MNKPGAPARRLGELVGKCLSPTLARQGFASTELVTRWPDIVGEEVAANAEPIRINWPRQETDGGEPATLVLRVEGPVAIEVQHLSGVIIERVNRFFGWRAVGRIALRQAPMVRRERPAPPPAPSAEATSRIAATLSDIVDDGLRQALARLGAVIKRT